MKSSVVLTTALDVGFVLAAERYDPRRTAESAGGTRLGDLAREASRNVAPASLDDDTVYLVLDTGDVKDGFVTASKAAVTKSEVGSTKKILEPGDVVISRLRPYLRQVAYVDPDIFHQNGNPVTVLCSTEFYVLRGEMESIAYLAAVLLSPAVQAKLAAAQEGGHHPRFDKSVLMSLSVPVVAVERASAWSPVVESASSTFRASMRELAALAETVDLE